MILKNVNNYGPSKRQLTAKKLIQAKRNLDVSMNTLGSVLPLTRYRYLTIGYYLCEDHIFLVNMKKMNYFF